MIDVFAHLVFYFLVQAEDTLFTTRRLCGFSYKLQPQSQSCAMLVSKLSIYNFDIMLT